jgi:hypothetical protein
MIVEHHPTPSTAQGSGAPDPHSPKSLVHRFIAWCRHEVRKLLVVAVFFFLSLTLLRFTRGAILHRFDAEFLHPVRTIIFSLVVAKVVLITDAFRFVARLDRRPLIVAAFWKSWIYLAVTIIFMYLEFLFDHRREGWTEANRRYLAQLSDPVFFMLHVWLLVLLGVFTLARDMVARFGLQRFLKLLWGKPEGPPEARD